MKSPLRKTVEKETTSRNAWLAVGSLVALGVLYLTVRELPSIRRELRLMRM